MPMCCMKETFWTGKIIECASEKKKSESTRIAYLFPTFSLRLTQNSFPYFSFKATMIKK